MVYLNFFNSFLNLLHLTLRKSHGNIDYRIICFENAFGRHNTVAIWILKLFKFLQRIHSCDFHTDKLSLNFRADDSGCCRTEMTDNDNFCLFPCILHSLNCRLKMNSQINKVILFHGQIIHICYVVCRNGRHLESKRILTLHGLHHIFICLNV